MDPPGGRFHSLLTFRLTEALGKHLGTGLATMSQAPWPESSSSRQTMSRDFKRQNRHSQHFGLQNLWVRNLKKLMIKNVPWGLMWQGEGSSQEVGVPSFSRSCTSLSC